MTEPSSKMDKIKNIIFEYLYREIVKDAILIKGKWGSGKNLF
jgi:hypothetical protein